MYKFIVLFFLTQNDMIGPPGYGEARFISLTTPLKYKIRFENEANATAPAQHVIILHTLDQDWTCAHSGLHLLGLETLPGS